MNYLILMGIAIIHGFIFPHEAVIAQQQFYNLSRYWTWKIKTFKPSLWILEQIVFPIAGYFIHPFFYFISLVVVFDKIIQLARKKYIKPLVWTARIKRLFIAYEGVLLCIGVVMIPFSINVFSWFAFLSILFLPWVFSVSFCLVWPFEWFIKHYYFKKALNKLTSIDPIVIGITGSYGKTSTKNYLYQLLKITYNTAVTPNSYNTPMGITKTILNQLNPLVKVFIVELGVDSRGGMKKLLQLVHPTHALITAIGPQHLATFKSIAAIQKEKLALAESIKGGMVVLNGDNPYLNNAHIHSQANIIYYGLSSEFRYSATIQQMDGNGTTLTLHWPNQDYSAWTPLLGRHHLRNVLGAVVMANGLNVPMDEIIRKLRTLQHEPHRLSRKTHGNWLILDDSYNSNFEGFKAALEVLKELPERRVLITPGLIELGDQSYPINFQLGQLSSQMVDEVYLIGKQQTIPFKEGLVSQGFEAVHVFDTFQEANYQLLTRQEEHLTILIENDLPDIILP